MTQIQITHAQHYVPRFYLKGFANDDEKLAIYDCKNARMSRTRAYGAVCYKDFFYAARTGNKDEVSQIIEKEFSQIETALSIRLPTVISKIERHQALAEEERLIIATLMSMLWLRGPVMREQINQMDEHMLKEMMAWRAKTEPIADFIRRMENVTGKRMSETEAQEIRNIFKSKSYSVSLGNEAHLRFQSEIEGFRNLFYGKKWNVYLAFGKYKFITTDNPVAEYHVETALFLGNDFMSRTHYFALTPTVLIEAVHPPAETGKKLRRKTLFDSEEDRAVVLRHNFFLAKKAIQFAYSKSSRELEQLNQSVQMLRGANLYSKNAGQSR